jgi:AraC-like DNA-binding protein
MPEFNSVSPILISYFKAPRTHQVTPFKIRPGFEVIELVTNGVIYFQSGKRDLKLGCGAMFWHRTGEETIHHTEPSAPYECLAVHFSVGPHTSKSRPAPRLTIISDLQRATELSRELLHTFHDTSVNRHELAKYAYARFLWEAHLGAIRHTIQVRPASITAALNYLETHFHKQEVGVRDLAKAGNISEPHLHMLFRKCLDETPHQALLSRRLHEAKLLLSGTSDSIKSLPSKCGFAGIETFYRAFKSHIGMTPLAYRQRHLHAAINQHQAKN